MDRRSASSPGSAARKPPRRIACVRCRTRKKRCDHAVPTCGECRRTGSECQQYGSRKSGSVATVPVAYLQQLEEQVAEMQARKSSISVAAAPPSDQLPELDDASTSLQEQSVYSPAGLGDNSPGEVHVAPPGGGGGGSMLGSGVAGEDDTPMISLSGGHYQGADMGLHFDRRHIDTRHAGTGATPSHRPPICATPSSVLGPVPGSMTWVERSFPPGRDPTMPRAQDAMLLIGEEWLDHYADIYYRHVQPQWSFLDEDAWRAAYATWKIDPSQPEGAHKFILQIVLAIGALMSSSFRPECPHLAHAIKLHDGAIWKNLNHVTQHASNLIRTQASLVMLLYAFHGPSPDPIPGSIMLALMNCANLMSQAEGSDPAAKDLGRNYEYIRRHTIMSSHILNEVVASAWTYPQPFMFEFLDDTIYNHVSRMTFKDELGFYEHLFQLRCIQSKIRHVSKKVQKLDASDQFREQYRVRLKEELRAWKESIQEVVHSSPPDSSIYHQPGSLSKLYDYSLSILMQERPCMQSVEDVGQLVKACSEACQTFQSSQLGDSVIYWTWSALMYQFRLGIMLLYCYSMTPPNLRTPAFTLDSTLGGLESCRKTLAGFAARWPRALVFLQTYNLLANSTFDGAAGTTAAAAAAMAAPPLSGPGMLESPSSQSLCAAASYTMDDERKSQVRAHVVDLKMMHVHEAVVMLIEEMVYKPRPEELSYDSFDFAPNVSFGGFDLFNFTV